MRIYAVSDLHTDVGRNFAALERMPLAGHGSDALIVAGDIGEAEQVVRATLELLLSRFAEVFFVPGNHELWVREDGRDSLEKLDAVLALCAELGVRTTPASAGGAWVVPLLSWYHADFDVAGEGVEAELEGWGDRYFCRWPAGTGRLDEALLDLNTRHLRPSPAPVITFSHFVPRPELVLPVHQLRFRGLPLVAGSLGIERQLRQVGSRVHVFGHTHIPVDRTIDGVRYVHNHFRPDRTRHPLTLVWDSSETAEVTPLGC